MNNHPAKHLAILIALAGAMPGGCRDSRVMGAGDTLEEAIGPIPTTDTAEIDPADDRFRDRVSDPSAGDDRMEPQDEASDHLHAEDAGTGDSVGDPGGCDIGGSGPVPFVASADYLQQCMRHDCCEGKMIDPNPVELAPFQVEWAQSPIHPLPPCVAGAPNLLIVRATWRDIPADPPDPVVCPEAPCGGQCFPSGGKVYLVDTLTDRVRYLGDEDPAGWGSGNPGAPVLGGWKVEISTDKAYIFHSTTPTMGTCDGAPCVLPWAICFLEVQDQKCVHFPLVGPTGDCPLTELTQAQFTFPNLRIPGECGVW